MKVKVLEVNPEAHRLALSIKALTSKPAGEESHSAPKAEKNDYQENNSSYQDNDEGGFTLGDLIGDELKHSTDDDQK